MINSILASIGRIYKKALAKTKDWCGVLQNFSKVANMTNPKSKYCSGSIISCYEEYIQEWQKLGINETDLFEHLISLK